MNLRPAISFTLCLMSAACARAQQQCTNFDARVARTYGFKPSALNAAQRSVKSNAMDSVWQDVHAHRELLPCLRAAIEKRTNDPYFQFDGSMLLVSMDSSPAAKALEVAALSRTDLGDLELADWMHAVTQRALEGYDVVNAAAKWLALPDSAATYNLPQHSYKVSKSTGALFLFGSLPESLSTPYLVSVARDAGAPNRETALWLLMQQETPESRTFLKSASRTGLSSDAQAAIDAYVRGPTNVLQGTGAPRLRRDEFLSAFKALRRGDAAPFMALVERVPNGEQDAAMVLTADDLPDVRYARRFFISAGTPESVEYYRDFTSIIETVLSRAR